MLRATLAARPGFVPALANLGLALCELERPEEAVDVLEEAVAARPDAIEAHFGLAQAYSALYRLDEAAASYRKVLELRPNFVAARWNLSHLLLLGQHFEEGWRLFDARWEIEPLAALRWRGTVPQWLGEDLRGKTLYVFSEQGFGDTLQFVRYVPLAVERGARVILRVQPELVRLVATMDGVQEVSAYGPPPPQCDFYCPIMSLPRAFGTTLANVPARVPYFLAGPGRGRGMDAAAGAGAAAVGLVWSSGIRFGERSIFYAGISKSMTLAQFGCSARSPG